MVPTVMHSEVVISTIIGASSDRLTLNRMVELPCTYSESKLIVIPIASAQSELTVISELSIITASRSRLSSV